MNAFLQSEIQKTGVSATSDYQDAAKGSVFYSKVAERRAREPFRLSFPADASSAPCTPARPLPPPSPFILASAPPPLPFDLCLLEGPECCREE